jgi:hypothetical protein
MAAVGSSCSFGASKLRIRTIEARKETGAPALREPPRRPAGTALLGSTGGRSFTAVTRVRIPSGTPTKTAA